LHRVSALPISVQLRSTEIYPNTATGSFDDIDFEFITYRNKACSMWLNSWQK
jgi:hypothetical protein